MNKYILLLLTACGPLDHPVSEWVAKHDAGVDSGVVVLDAGSVPDAGVCVSTGCSGLICEVAHDNCGNLCNCNSGCTRIDCKKNTNPGPKQCCVIQKFVCALDVCEYQ